MNRIKLRPLALALLLAGAIVLPARAAGEEPVEIRDYEGLLQLAQDPAGSYRLAADIDLAGKPWTPVDFTGTLDGGGHALLNVTVTGTGEGAATTYDGNYKTYETAFAGFFGTLKGAAVTDLSLVNLRADVTADGPCFLGGLAGYAEDAVIRGCQVQGTLALTAHDRMFGVGGIVGYGSGSIADTSAQVTLVCTDTDAENRDEQFMGGAYAAGHLDLKNCRVDINGYVSDHGYVHNGGLVGMYIFYPSGLDYHGTVAGNTVTGQITFFEDNTDRRAYCDGFMGEIMNWDFTNGGNDTAAFTRNEVFDYSVDLKPHMCDGPAYTETVTAPGCESFGYTTLWCETCGYTDTDCYTLPQHTVTAWVTTLEPTAETAGLQEGTCDLCGEVLTREVEPLPPTPPPTPEPTPEPAPREETGGIPWLPVLLGVVLAAAVLAALWKFTRPGGRREGR